MRRNAIARSLNDTRMRRHVVSEPNISTYNSVMANADPAKYRSVGINRDIVFDDWMARHVHRLALFVILEILGTERHALIEHHVRPDDSSLANHYTCAMIYAEMVANLSSRMNVDTRLAVSHLGEHTRDERHAELIESMGRTIVKHHTDERIAIDHLSTARHGWIVVHGSIDIHLDESANPGHRLTKILGDALGFFGIVDDGRELYQHHSLEKWFWLGGCWKEVGEDD